MKNPTTDNQKNGAPGALWPSVLKIDNDEFRQSYAVAQLAVKLSELEMAKQSTALLKQNLDPAEFLDKAWKLIESARDRVLREQTGVEYLVSHGGAAEAADAVVERKLNRARIPFQKLCDPH